MRILFLTDNFPPEVNAPATRTYEHCREWIRQGVEVTVITCAPNFPRGKVFEGYRNSLYQKEVIDGITVIRVWSYIAPNSGFIKRILDFVSFAVMAFWVGLFQKFDVLVGTSPQFFTAVSSRLISFFRRKPWVMEVRDLWPESIAAVGALSRRSLAYRILEKVERHLYRSADAIIVVTNSFKHYIHSLGITTDKIHVVTNGVDASKFQPAPKNQKLLEELELEGKFLIGYIGTHGMAHALGFILESARHIEDRDVHIILQGDGAEKNKLVAKAKELQLSNVTFLPFVAKNEIRQYISILDVALVNLKKSDTFKSVIPSKIFENACMLKPILHGVEGESKEIIDRYNAGITFEPENRASFLSAVDMIRQEDNMKKYKAGCARLAKAYERSTLAREMLEVIAALAK